MRDPLFQPLQIGAVEVKNRIGMAAMCVFGMVTPDGCFGPRAVEYYVERAKAGVGLIITGYTEVENEVEICPPGVTTNTSLHPPRFIAAAGEMTERVHAYGAKIFLQLTMGMGRAGYAPWVKGDAVAPSAVPNAWLPDSTCRALTVEEIEYLIQKMGEGAATAKKAGFDGVEIHAIHEGYLLDQFATALFNQRQDEFGGDLERRLTFARRIREEIAKTCGDDFPVAMRFSVRSFIEDWNKGGLLASDPERGRTLEEGLEIAKRLEAYGYDALDADCGSIEGFFWAHPPGYMGHGVYLPYVKHLKSAVSIPVLTAGRMDDPDLARRALNEGWVDMALLGRGLLADAEWADKVREGREADIRPCLGCHNGCLGRGDLCRPLSCTVNPACGRESEYPVPPAAEKKKILVIGGGVAGMEAARVAAGAGHDVHLYEASDRLGGHLIAAGIPAFKEDEKALLRWYLRQMEAVPGITLHLNHEIEAEEVLAANADTVIVATGSDALLPDVPGILKDHVYTVEEILAKPDLAESYIVVGGGLSGAEAALFLHQAGKEVSIVEMRDEFLEEETIPHANRMVLKALLQRYGIDVRISSKVSAIRDDGIEVKGKGETAFLPAGGIVVAAGYAQNDELFTALAALHSHVLKIGDCRGGHNLMDAIWDGYEVTRKI